MMLRRYMECQHNIWIYFLTERKNVSELKHLKNMENYYQESVNDLIVNRERLTPSPCYRSASAIERAVQASNSWYRESKNHDVMIDYSYEKFNFEQKKVTWKSFIFIQRYGNKHWRRLLRWWRNRLESYL